MHPMLTIAIRAARQIGNFIIKIYENPNFLEKITKNENNVIINFDKKIERIIIEIIKKSYPTHNILIKTNNKIFIKNNNVQWIINYLDSMINFSKHIPHFAISIAVRINNRTELAVIYNFMLNELFTAVRGQGAQLNGYRLRIKNTKLEESIIGISFPLKEKQYLISYIKIITKLFKKCNDFRCTGSSVLDLAYIAAKRIDAFFQIGLTPWDFIAGELLIREAGGIITDLIGGHNYFISGNLLAGSPQLIKKIIIEIKNELNDQLKY